MKDNFAKILIIRFSSIGDIVLTTPVIRCLKQQFDGDVEIHFLTKENYVSVIAANPYVSKIYTLPAQGAVPSKLLKTLKHEHYDYVIDLHKNTRSYIVKNNIKKPTFSFNKLNWEKWLLVNLKIDKLPATHIVERYLEALSVFNIKNDHRGLDYFIPENDNITIANVFPELKNTPYIAWVIGAAHNTKKLPTQKIIDACREIAELPIVLIGGKEDMNNGYDIVKATNNTVNACGKFNINQSASIIQQAGLVVTNDTGMMHIAAAFNKPIVSIWGNTVPKFGMYPYEPQAHENVVFIENTQLNCRPCSKIGFKQCPYKHFKCMNAIHTLEIVEAIIKLWRKAGFNYKKTPENTFSFSVSINFTQQKNENHDDKSKQP